MGAAPAKKMPWLDARGKKRLFKLAQASKPCDPEDQNEAEEREPSEAGADPTSSEDEAEFFVEGVVVEEPDPEHPFTEIIESAEEQDEDEAPANEMESSHHRVRSMPRRSLQGNSSISVCTVYCRNSYRVVCEAIRRLGWTEIKAFNQECSVMWAEHSDPIDGYAPVQTVTRMDPFLHFCRKARFAQTLNPWTKELPDIFGFTPRTWLLPDALASLKKTMESKQSSGTTYIAKPTAGHSGIGIVLAKKWRDLSDIVRKCRKSQREEWLYPEEYVVQSYIARPLLLDGFKFDLRLYVVITSVVPLRVYLFKEGLARLCTLPYHAPKSDNLQDVRMHLTNFAINRKSKDFQPSDGIAQGQGEKNEKGSKRSASAVFRQIEQTHGVRPDSMWQKVSQLVANTFMALRPGLLEYYVHESPFQLHPMGPKSFQIIGLDVLIDSKLDLHLLELNANPSLAVVQPASQTEAQASEKESQTSEAQASEKEPPTSENSSAENSFDVESQSPAEAPQRSLSPNRTSQTACIAADGVGSGTTSQRSAGAQGKNVNGRRHSSFSYKPGRRHSSFCVKPGLAKSTTPPTPPSKNCNTIIWSPERKRNSLRPESGIGDVMIETSELDLEIKSELVRQALLLANPASKIKAARLRRKFLRAAPRPEVDLVALDDDEEWLLFKKQAEFESVLGDADVQKCQSMEVVDCQSIAASLVVEFAQAHLALYCCWRCNCDRGCSMGQAQMLRLLERCGFIGPGAPLSDKVAARLWLSPAWRDAAGNALGLNFVQFVAIAGRFGRFMLGRQRTTVADDICTGTHDICGVTEFVRRGKKGWTCVPCGMQKVSGRLDDCDVWHCEACMKRITKEKEDAKKMKLKAKQASVLERSRSLIKSRSLSCLDQKSNESLSFFAFQRQQRVSSKSDAGSEGLRTPLAMDPTLACKRPATDGMEVLPTPLRLCEGDNGLAKSDTDFGCEDSGSTSTRDTVTKTSTGADLCREDSGSTSTHDTMTKSTTDRRCEDCGEFSSEGDFDEFGSWFCEECWDVFEASRRTVEEGNTKPVCGDCRLEREQGRRDEFGLWFCNDCWDEFLQDSSKSVD